MKQTSIALLSGLLILALQLFSNKADAVAIPTTSLTTTAGAMTATTTCTTTGGYYAAGWTGSPTKYWEYQVNTTGYSSITMSFPTTSSGTGPTTASVYYNISGTDVLVTSYSITTSCATKNITLPAACNNQSNLIVRLKLTGASAAGGTNRVPFNVFDGTSSGCSSAPTAGTISATNTFMCGSGSSVLSLSGATSGTGITYQWQVSTTGTGGWSNVGTGATYNTGTLTATRYYRCIVTCTTVGLSDTTAVQTITVSPIPTVNPITGVNAAPLLINEVDTLGDTTPGGVWSSSNTNVATIDPVTGIITAKFGGTTTITYLVDNGSGCTNTATATVNVVWPNTLALYAGANGSNTNVIGIPGETVNTLGNANFGTPNTPCTTGGLSGLTVPATVTAYDPVAGPYVSYIVTPDAGKALNIFRIHAITRESGTGPTKARIAFRIAGGPWIDEGVDVAQSTGGSCGASSTSWDYTPGVTINGITDPLEVAVFPYAPGAGTGTFQLNSLEVYGYVTDTTPCAGVPMAGVVTPASTNICDSGSRWLTYTGAVGVGISYQWQKSTTSATAGFSDISGANNASYNTGVLHAGTDGPVNYYRVKITCDNTGDTSVSVADTVNINAVPTPSFVLPSSPFYIKIGTPVNLTSYASGGGYWRSDDTSSTSIDSASGLATAHIPGFSVISYRVSTGGCTGVARDSVFAVLPNTRVLYMGMGGNSTAVTTTAGIASTGVAKVGFGTATACGRGGVSGMTNNGVTSYSSAGAHVSMPLTFTAPTNFTGIHVTARRSGSGIQNMRIAYNINNTGWIDNGSDLNVDADDCGYSVNLSSFTGAISVGPGDAMEVAVYGYNPASTGGTFQVNTISVTGAGTPVAKQAAAVGNVAANNAVKLYPNPASTTLNVVAAENVNVEVIALDGKTLVKQIDAKQINVSALANGLYIIKVYNQENNLIQTSKFTKQ